MDTWGLFFALAALFTLGAIGILIDTGNLCGTLFIWAVVVYALVLVAKGLDGG